ncbi:MAG: glutathione S-transferase [Myxococcota bacterium]
MAKILVHHLETSRSHRVLWMLEELELPYEMKVHKRDPVTIRASKDLRAIHPLGKAPMLDVDGTVLAESGAILEYCVEELTPGRFKPEAGTEAHRQYRYWMHYAEGSLMSPLLLRLVFDKVRTAPLPFFVKPIAKGIVKKVETSFIGPEVELHAGFIEQHLAANAFFAGAAFSAADVQMSYPVEALVTRGRVGSAMPKTKAWLEAMQARPAYARAIEKGGPNML